MKKNKCDCNDDCTCGDDCNCTEENKCSENCTCGEHEHDKHCDCEHDHDEQCDCEHDENCNCEDPNKAFEMYEKAFRQLEDALIKADKEIEAQKKAAEENEHLARVYKQDLERFKERNKNIEGESIIKANSFTALQIIPVLDNFDQALSAVTDMNVAKGFVMIHENLKEVLDSLGIEEIKALGTEFNPDLHECVTKTKAPAKGQSGLVSKVFKTGYKFKGEDGKVVRHTVVEIYE